MFKRFLILILSVFIIQVFPLCVYADEAYKAPNDIVYSRIKKENLIPASISSDLNMKTIKKGDIVAFHLVNPVEDKGKVIIPASCILGGKVVSYRKAMFFRADAYVDILLTSIQSDSFNKNIEKENIVLRIADYHYKSFWRRTLQRTPVVLCGVATSITLSAATDMNAAAYGAIAFGVGTAVGFISGLIDPDIDKTRWDGAVLRGIEGSPYGTVVITVQKGYGLDAKSNDTVFLRVDGKIKKKLLAVFQTNSI